MIGKRRSVRVLLVASLLVSSCSDSESAPGARDIVAQRQEAIWNGIEFQPTPPESSIVVRLEAGPEFPAPDRGSGIALNNRWVLTTSHVRGRLQYQYDQVRAYLAGNNAVSYTATNGGVITRGAWAHAGFTERIYDLEVIKFDPLPINGAQDFATPIFHGDAGVGDAGVKVTITDQIIASGSVQCWGYGLGGPAGAAGKLRYADLAVNGDPKDKFKFPNDANEYELAPPRNFFTIPTNGRQFAHGDSGGPCFRTNDMKLVGIMRGVAATTPPTPENPSPLGVVTSVAAYDDDIYGNLDRQLQRIADNNPEYAAFLRQETTIAPKNPASSTRLPSWAKSPGSGIGIGSASKRKTIFASGSPAHARRHRPKCPS